MPRPYTPKLFENEFATDVPSLPIIPLLEVARDVRGAAVHKGGTPEECENIERNLPAELLPRIQEQRAKGTVISALEDHLGLPDYWARNQL
jgi:hypothetical protein